VQTVSCLVLWQEFCSRIQALQNSNGSEVTAQWKSILHSIFDFEMSLLDCPGNEQNHHGSKTEEINQLIVVPSVNSFWSQISCRTAQLAQSTIGDLNCCTTVTKYEQAVELIKTSSGLTSLTLE